MFATTCKRGLSLFLAVLLCFTAVLGFGTTTAFAAGEQSDVYLVAYPREGDANLDYSGTWGHDNLRYMNGWSSGRALFTIVRAMGSYEGNICYCIEPGVPLETGDSLSKWGEDFWENYPSDYNHTIEPYEIKQFIGRIMQYGYTGSISTSWRSQNEGADKLAYAVATQLLIWETVVGERDSDFSHVSTGGYNAVTEQIGASHPLRSQIFSYYSMIEANVQSHSKIPSFMSKFNKLIRQCKRGKVDMIIVKSISRFARNTLDCLKITRMLRELKVDVYFEEQNLHSIDPSSEFYISIYGSVAQSESENISHNVTWGKARSAKEGNVFFAYKSFLGYHRGADGKPEIDPEQANTVRRIYDRFLAGDSLQQIANGLTADGIPTPMSRTVWQASVVQSILSNEKYKGDALLGKTYVEDCISKKVRVNAGERPQYYVENNHPAIIDTATFARVQEELARRASKRKVKQTGTTTEQGKYCGKYALTELLICGECGTPYRRCTWTVGGKKRIVWRCINRLDYGKKYCHHSPTMEEAPLQNAIMDAVLKTAQIDPNILQTLKQHIRLGLGAGAGEDKSVEIQIRIAQIDQEFKSLLNSVTAENQQELLTDPRITDLMTEKRQLEKELAEYAAAEQHRQNTASRLDNIFTILDGMKNHPLTYDDAVIRQILQCVIVESKEKIKVVFIGGMEVETEVEQ